MFQKQFTVAWVDQFNWLWVHYRPRACYVGAKLLYPEASVKTIEKLDRSLWTNNESRCGICGQYINVFGGRRGWRGWRG